MSRDVAASYMFTKYEVFVAFPSVVTGMGGATGGGAMSPTFGTSGVQGGQSNENDLCFYSRLTKLN